MHTVRLALGGLRCLGTTSARSLAEVVAEGASTPCKRIRCSRRARTQTVQCTVCAWRGAGASVDAGSPVECRRQRAARRGLQQPERTGFVRVGVVVGQAGRALLGFSTSPLGLASEAESFSGGPEQRVKRRPI